MNRGTLIFLLIAGILLAVVVCAPMVALPLFGQAEACPHTVWGQASACPRPCPFLATTVPFRAPPV